MNEAFQDAVDALDNLEKQIENSGVFNGLLTDSYGYNHPALFKSDLRDAVTFTKKKIVKYGEIELTRDEIEEVEFISRRVTAMTAIHVPYLLNGNGSQSIPAFFSTLTYINMFLDDLFSPERLEKATLVPKNMLRRIRSLDLRINEVEPEVERLDEKIKSINEAHTAAENIPIDLEELRRYKTEAAELQEKIQKIHFGFENADTDSQKHLSSLAEKNEKANEYLSLCEKAIVASTSKGLAGAFEIKARNLNWTILAWVTGLLLALGAGGWIGYKRLEVLSLVLEKANPSTAVIATQLMLSLFSVAAPLWFAWMSTKQINQRFKLAEDYAFKSAVAKAYEGYKNEAARVSDGDFEKRLFDSALTRLEEAPLRLIKEDDHGTPWAEMLNSKSFQNFLDASIENIDFVKGLLNKKAQQNIVASNDDNGHKEIKQSNT
ncbi:hypothetical protein I4P58_12280 [Enterobacter roggenkampii]|uniref:hypothetical protein n=1 Tax=Enterobacter roggenkampii TaxID=1812935 RepID=UPI0018C32FAE|nr:hypothetical protein [Enterobacter roggenkampii]MBF9817792.1 hypothetical protein [Enterobacter roggenkampii]